MSRYSGEEQWQDVLAMIRETLQHVDATLADRSHGQVSGDVRTWHAVLYGEPPSEHGVALWKREASEQEAQFARARTARARNMQLARASTAAIYEQRIAKVEMHLAGVIRAMDRVTENIEAELRELPQKGTEAETRLSDLATKLAEALPRISQLCETVAADCKSILDLSTRSDPLIDK